MQQHTAFSKLALTTTCIAMPCFALADHDRLSLKQGTYLVTSSVCKEPAFAAMKSWDGVGFSGPHSSECTSRVLSRHGNQFTITTTCAALGDGTPDRSGYVDNFLLTRLSNIRFNIRKDNEPHPETTYRWCPARSASRIDRLLQLPNGAAHEVSGLPQRPKLGPDRPDRPAKSGAIRSWGSNENTFQPRPARPDLRSKRANFI